VRAALGLTATNKLLLVTIARPITLSRLAKLMKALGARDAINLDGGTSTAIAYRGRVLHRPGRRLTNVLLVYDFPAAYRAARSQILPRGWARR